MNPQLFNMDRTLDLFRALPEDRQLLVADLVEDLARRKDTYTLSAEERAVCEASLASPMASEAEVYELLNKPW